MPDLTSRVNVLPATPAVSGNGAPAPAAENPLFRGLLDRMERLAKDDTPPVEDTDALQHALSHADRAHTDMMDLRRQLERAYHARTR